MFDTRRPAPTNPATGPVAPMFFVDSEALFVVEKDVPLTQPTLAEVPVMTLLISTNVLLFALPSKIVPVVYMSDVALLERNPKSTF